MIPRASILSLLIGAMLVAPRAAAEPWRLDRALGLPESITLQIQHRVRYEALDDQFRAGRAGDDDLLLIRTLVHARWRVGGGLSLGAEIQDSRAHLDDPSTPVTTGMVNAGELLQAYAELERPLLGGEGRLRIGRTTLDVGSRRFVARNRFRNTLNGFSGIDAEWTGSDGRSARAFWVMPLRRRPADDDALRDDDVQIDEESLDVQLWGLHGAAGLPWGEGRDRAELFVFGLHEEHDASGTRNRDLFTPGLRLRRKPQTGRIDYEIETALQLGESRSTRFGPDLDHFAHFHHVEAGYTFDAAWTPRLALQYDYASGDEDPDDGENGRFDTLFGARRFDFGPTSLYGPFARANLSTPGVRLQVKPSPTVTSFVAARAFWLAEKRDAWTTSGVRDPAGDSGSFVGAQIELRLRWEVVPGNVRLETGAAHLFDGEFVRRAPGSNRQGDSSYAYAQLVLTL